MIKEELEKQIMNKMQERNYSYLCNTTNDKFIVYSFHTPLEDKIKFNLDVIVENNNIYFQFRKMIDRIFEVHSNKIGSFFNDEHFNKFEARFTAVANWCQCYDRNVGFVKGEDDEQ